VRHRQWRLKILCALAMTGSTVAGLLAPTLTAQAAGKPPTYYVSLGDSYSVGYQPGRGATAGYTAVVAKSTGLKLVNFGCGGATTSSLVSSIGCPDVLPHTAGAVLYPTTTQEAAAEAFLTAHRGHIGLITVSIGGNDVTSCATQANPVACVATAVTGGIPVPGFSAALAYYDALRAERLPAALVQGLRDFFGAHTYRRTDAEGSFHTLWADDRSEVSR